MRLVDGVHHLTFLSEDMDRLVAFCARVFDAEITLDMTEAGLRPAGPSEEAFRELRACSNA